MKKLILLVTYIAALTTGAQVYTPDVSFGDNGQKKLFPLQTYPGAEFHEIAFVNDRYIMVNNNTVYAVQTNGSLDDTFGSNGKVSLSTGNQDYWINSVKVTSDVIYLAGGYSFTNPSKRGMFIAKLLLADGTYDVDFGINGIARTDYTDNNYWYHGFTGLEITPTDEMYGIGEASEGTVLCRILPNGTLDTTFAPTGKKLISNILSSNAAVFYHNNGLFLITEGYSHPLRWLNFITMDGSGNLTVLPNTIGLGMGTISNITFFKEGNQLVYGVQGSNTPPPNLQPFGWLGSVDMASGNAIFSVSVDPDSRVHLQQSKIWVTDSTMPNGSTAPEDFRLRRFNMDGTSDQTFALNGMLSYNFQDANPSAYTVDLAQNVYVHPDGTLLLAGRTSTYESGLYEGAVRFQLTPLGTGSNLNLAKAIIFPNPVTSELHIQKSFDAVIEAYSVSDVIGRTILHGTSDVEKLDVAMLQPGTYILTLASGNSLNSFKFIKR